MRPKRVLISGRVQGVGYRAWTADAAERLGLDGWVRNLPDGRVEALLAGDATDRMVEKMRDGPSFASVDAVEVAEAEGKPAPGFRIRR